MYLNRPVRTRIRRAANIVTKEPEQSWILGYGKAGDRHTKHDLLPWFKHG